MHNKKSHWGLRTIGALNVMILPLATMLLMVAPQMTEAFYMLSITFCISSIVGGFALWSAASKLDRLE